MKKTIVALLALVGVATAGTTSYTWNTASNLTGSVMNGTVDGTLALGTYDNYEEGLKVITGTVTYTERNTTVLYNLINDAIEGNSILTISGDISVGSTTSDLVILHAGRDGYGLTLGIKGGDLVLTNTNIDGTAIFSADISLNSSANNKWYLTDYTVTIGKGGVVTYSVGGGNAVTASNTFSANWYTGTENGGETQNYMYSFGHRAPGWTGQTFGGNFHTTGVTITSQTVPEPATATLSLLALTGLAARRRRK